MTQSVFSSAPQVTSFLSVVASPHSATATVSVRMGLLSLICVNCRRCRLEVSSPHDGPQASCLAQRRLVLASRPKEIFGGSEKP